MKRLKPCSSVHSFNNCRERGRERERKRGRKFKHVQIFTHLGAFSIYIYFNMSKLNKSDNNNNGPTSQVRNVRGEVRHPSSGSGSTSSSGWAWGKQEAIILRPKFVWQAVPQQHLDFGFTHTHKGESVGGETVCLQGMQYFLIVQHSMLTRHLVSRTHTHTVTHTHMHARTHTCTPTHNGNYLTLTARFFSFFCFLYISTS